MSFSTVETRKEVKCGVGGFNWEESLDFTKIHMTTEHISEAGLEDACAKYEPHGESSNTYHAEHFR